MPNIASVLKAEISRIARKESRAETDSLKRMTSSQRSDIVALKRRVHELERTLKAVLKASSGRPVRASEARATGEATDANGLRFRAKGLASNRKRLGLSADDFGLLVGATAQSVYSWEAGKTKPRGNNLAAIAALRGVGKREVSKRLESLKR